MDLEPQSTISAECNSEGTVETELQIAEPIERKPLEVLRDTERSLRSKTVRAIVPLLPEDPALTVLEASQKANRSLEELAKIDFDKITDAELKPARTLMGLTFIGFGGLMLLILSLGLSALHPELNATDQIHQYWHQYVWVLGFGVAGLVMLGREAMRPPEK